MITQSSESLNILLTSGRIAATLVLARALQAHGYKVFFVESLP